MKKVRICHLTSVHTRTDIRIFHKECVSLSDYFEVYLILADGKGDEKISNINIIDVGKPKGRIGRFLFTTKKIYKQAIKINPEIYHFHDPELIYIGTKLRKKNKTVFYDIHEDVPRQILAKSYILGPIRKIVSMYIEKVENKYCREFNGLICATPHINKRFLKINLKSININNYPILKEFNSIDKNWNQRDNSICYIGALSADRGIFELIESLRYSNYQLCLAGECESREIYDLITNSENSQKVKYYGTVNRKKIVEILSSSKIGIVTLRYTPNHFESLPIKMFEYMCAGMPVIASDFPLWKSIIEGNNCGICVDPMKPEKIAEAVNYLIENDEIAKKMGENGRRAVMDKYNWETEKEKLITIYKSCS